MKRRLAVAATLTALALLLREPARVYTLFLPITARALSFRHGLAGGNYYRELNADWYYTWGWCEMNCVPMVKFWQLPPACPTWLMLGNEPDGAEASGGAPIDPTEAAAISRTIRAQCPATQFIVGGTIQAGIQWLDSYIASHGEYDRLATHCYSREYAETCELLLTQFAQHFAGIPFCVTEWNILGANPPSEVRVREFTRLLYFIQGLTDCSAVFTDVQGYPWWGEGIDASLVTAGELNALGQAYAR